MKEHEHATNKKPDTRPAHDEVAKKAYASYLEEGRTQGRDVIVRGKHTCAQCAAV